MNLKDKKKKTFDINSIINFAKGKKEVNQKRSTGSSLKSFGDFGSKPNSPRSKSKGNLTKRQVILRRIAIFSILSFLFIGLFGILVLLGVVSAMSRDLPDVDKYIADSQNQGTETIIYDRNGTELYRLRGDIVAEKVAIKDVPEKLQWAFMAAEDANFRTHKGLDLFGLTRAITCAVGNYAQGKSYESCAGGSSITQQLIKVTTAEDQRSLDRKIREAILAMKVEETYSKDEILESYMNVVGEGREYVGVKTGAIYIFDKPNLNDLSLAQMCYLAAIPNNPEVLSPRGAVYDPQQSQDRANYVLDRMYELRDKTGITDEEYQKAKEEIPNMKFASDKIDIKAGHFVNEVLNEIDRIYADKVKDGQKGRDYLRTQGYRVYTTLDLPTEELLEKTLKEQIDSPEFQAKTGAQTGSGIIMDVKTGDILAMAGSKDFYATSNDVRFSPQFNATTAERSVGSSIKPFVYGSTFEKGYNPSSIVPDIPIDQSPSAAVRPGAPYPQNFNVGVFGAYASQSTSGRGDFKPMRLALRYSLNQPAVAAYNYVGTEQVADFYVRASGNPELRDNFQGASAALGAANVPLVDHASAYTTIADMGLQKPHRYILKIDDEQGNTVYDNTKVETKQVMEKSVAYLINNMNENYYIFASDPDPRKGPNAPALIKEVRKTTDFAGKTGTSDTDRAPGDLVFMGYTPNVVMGFWAGNSCGSQDPACPPMKKTAESQWVYDYIFTTFLNSYKSKLQPGRFNQPEGLKKVSLCNLTGNAYGEDCAKAGGSALQELVSDKSMPKQEDLIEKQSVTDCGGTTKLARDIDRQLGLAKDIYVVRYDKLFPQKYINDQITKYLSQLKTKPLITETCNITRTTNPPVVTVTNPINGGTYSQLETVTISANVTSDLPLQKVEIINNNNGLILKTYGPSDPVSFAIDLSSYSTGSQAFSVVATNNQGKSTTSTVTINIISGATAIVQNPVQGQQITKSAVGANYQLQGRVVGISQVNTVSFRITGGAGGPVTVNATQSGNIWVGAWALPVADSTKSYTITIIVNGNNMGSVSGIQVV